MAETVKFSHEKGKANSKVHRILVGNSGALDLWVPTCFTSGIQNQEATQSSVELMGCTCGPAEEYECQEDTERSGKVRKRAGDGTGKNRYGVQLQAMK